MGVVFWALGGSCCNTINHNTQCHLTCVAILDVLIFAVIFVVVGVTVNMVVLEMKGWL